jgi:hypothetical protein
MNKKVWTLTYKRPSDIVKVIGHESPAVAKKFRKVWDEIQHAQAERESENLDKIEYARDEQGLAGRSGFVVKAQDGKTYKAGDIVNVQWSNGITQALLGGPRGELHNPRGEVAVRELRWLEQKAKVRYISPGMIMGAPETPMYTPEEIQRKLGAFNINRQNTLARTAQKKAYNRGLRRQFGGF